MRKALITAFLSTLVFGCSSTSPDVAKNSPNTTKNNVITDAGNSDYSHLNWPSLSNNFSISYTHGYGTQDALAALNNTSNDVYLISLDKNGGKWQASIGPGGEEEVAVNVKTGRITILARAKEYSELGRGSNDITDTFKSSWVFQCKKSALNLFNSGEKRNICDSEFSKVYLNYNPREAVTEVFTSGAQAILLTKLYKAKLDKDALKAALEQSHAYSYLINPEFR